MWFDLTEIYIYGESSSRTILVSSTMPWFVCFGQKTPFYFFDTLSEKVVLFFTFNPEKKATKALLFAEERLAEIKTLTEEGGNANDIKTSITNYERNIALAAEKSKEIKDKGQEENLLNLITNSASKNQEVLSAVLIKVPDEAKEAITQAIEASKKGQEEATRQIAELKSEVEQLKKEVAELKAKDETQTKTVEELGKQKSESGSAPAKSPTPPVSEKPATPNQSQTLPKANEQQNVPSTNQQPTNTITSPPPVTVTPPTPAETFEITSVSVVPDMTSAKVEWQTNKPTESKIFISGGNLSSKIFNSVSGLSTRHSVTITGLSEETTYLYEIEAIASGVNVVKKQGSFKTLPPPPLFEFSPVIKVGNQNNELGKVYFSINESFNSGTYSIKDPSTGSYLITPRAYPVAPSEVFEVSPGFGVGKTYEYQFKFNQPKKRGLLLRSLDFGAKTRFQAGF